MKNNKYAWKIGGALPTLDELSDLTNLERKSP